MLMSNTSPSGGRDEASQGKDDILMTPATKELHATIIRLLKGVLSAWERWLQQQEVKNI